MRNQPQFFCIRSSEFLILSVKFKKDYFMLGLDWFILPIPTAKSKITTFPKPVNYPQWHLFQTNNPSGSSRNVGFFFTLLRRRLIASIHLNVGIMRATTFFPVISHFLADKWIRIFTSDIAAGADLAPSCQHFFHFHDCLLSVSALANIANPLSTQNNNQTSPRIILGEKQMGCLLFFHRVDSCQFSIHWPFLSIKGNSHMSYL